MKTYYKCIQGYSVERKSTILAFTKGKVYIKQDAYFTDNEGNERRFTREDSSIIFRKVFKKDYLNQTLN